MSYTIKVLTNKVKEHKEAIIDIKFRANHELYSEYLFEMEEIGNHQKCIDNLQKSIKDLLKIEKGS